MRHKRLAAVVILQVMVGLLFSLRVSRAMTEAATIKIAGNHPHIAITPEWRPAASDWKLNMKTVLALRNRAELQELKRELQKPGSANYHKWLSTAEFMRRFGPTSDQMDEVVKWLKTSGFAVTSSNIGTRTVHFSGSVANAERAFSTRILSNANFYANVSDPQVPAAIGNSIAAVMGLSGPLTAGRPRARAIADSAGSTPDYRIGKENHLSPQDLWKFYDEKPPTDPKNIGGTGPDDCIALLEATGLDTGALTTFTKRFKLPPVDLKVVLTDPLEGPGIAIANEIYLDVEWSHAVAPATPIAIYVTNGTDGGQFDALSLAVFQNACGVISSSIHNCVDLKQIAAYADVEAQAVMQGQTYFHASGDFGSYFDCGQPTETMGTTDVEPSIDESAATEDVTQVGGTQFIPKLDAKGRVSASIQPGDEHVWNVWAHPTAPIPRPPVKGASTGGISVVFSVPTWQVGIVPYGFQMSDPLTMRGVPDVSIMANEDEPGVWIVTTNEIVMKGGKGCGSKYCFTKEGGTSAGSPMWAGISRLLAVTLNTTRLGNINPRLYELANAKSAALVDVSQIGENCPYSDCGRFPGYKVGPNYDLGTGLGSPDIQKLLANF
ncbi:MAG TPA: S53 family peptidase [Candidatus Binataceae bacterium]